jgi:hypothetical protein
MNSQASNSTRKRIAVVVIAIGALNALLGVSLVLILRKPAAIVPLIGGGVAVIFGCLAYAQGSREESRRLAEAEGRTNT